MSDTFDFDQLWDYNQPEATEKQFRELLSSTNSSDVNYRLQLLTQIARAQGLQTKFDEAHNTLNEVATQLTDDLPTARIRYLLERGRVFNSSKQREHSRQLFLQAFELAQKVHEDFYAVDAAHMLGIVEPSDAQLDWNLKALTLAEHSEMPHARKWLGSLYNNIGWTYHDLQEYPKALELFEKALDWYQQEQGKERETRIARWTIARTLRSLNRIPDALKILRELEPVADGYTYEEIGECLLIAGNPTEAQPYFERAYQELSKDQWLVRNEPERLERLSKLGSAV